MVRRWCWQRPFRRLVGRQITAKQPYPELMSFGVLSCNSSSGHSATILQEDARTATDKGTKTLAPASTPTKKRTLLECASSPTPSKRSKENSPSKSPSSSPSSKFDMSNVDMSKRPNCDVCKVERPSDQRAASCPTCLKVLRQKYGHQSFSKVRGDDTIMREIADASLKIQAEFKSKKKPCDYEVRLSKLESKMDKLLEHFGLA